MFKSDLERLRSEYTIGTLAHDAALVRYVDQVSIAKNMAKDKLLRCSWGDISPMEAQLTSMPLLKELITMAALPTSYGQVKTPSEVLQPGL